MEFYEIGEEDVALEYWLQYQSNERLNNFQLPLPLLTDDVESDAESPCNNIN
jgi:hypothetical protein